MKIVETAVEDWLGLDRKTAPTQLKRGACQELDNWWLDDKGVPTKRDGKAKYNTAALPATPHSLHEYVKQDGTRLLLAFLNDGTTPKMYKSTGDGTWTQVTIAGTAWTSTAVVNGVTYQDRFYFGNGTDVNKAFDGTTVRDMGIAAPGSAPTVATGAAGVLNGAYQYKVSFLLHGTEESNGSAASAVVNPANQQVALSAIPTGGTGVTARKLYRTVAGGTSYRFLATINDNTTTTYTDNTADASLGTAVALTDQGIPPKGKYFVVVNEYLWIGGNPDEQSTAYSCERFKPDIQHANDFQKVADKDGDQISGLGAFLGRPIVGKKRAFAQILGSSPDTFDVSFVSREVGILDHRSIQLREIEGDRRLIFASLRGVYAFNGGTLDLISVPIEPDLLAASQYVVSRGVRIDTNQADFEAGTIPVRLSASRVPGSVAHLFLYDDFSDGDFTSNPVWTSRYGAWSVSSNFGLNWTGTGSAQAGISTKIAFTDGHLELRVRSGGDKWQPEIGGQLFIHFGMADMDSPGALPDGSPTNSYRVRIVRNSTAFVYYFHVAIEKRLAPSLTWTILAETDVTSTANNSGLVGLRLIRIYRNAGLIRVFLGEPSDIADEVLSVTDGSPLPHDVNHDDGVFVSKDGTVEFLFTNVAIVADQATFLSRIFDLGVTPSAWGTFVADTVVPTGSSLAFATRTATTSGGIAAASFVSQTNFVNVASTLRQFIQYRAIFSTGGTSGTVRSWLVAAGQLSAQLNSASLEFYSGGLAPPPMASAFYRNRYWLAVQVQGASANNLVFVLDRLGRWSTFRAYDSVAFSRYGDSLMLSGGTTGIVFQVTVGTYNDDGVAITSTLILGDLDYDESRALKILRALFVDALAANSNLKIAIAYDGGTYQEVSQLYDGSVRKSIKVFSGSGEGKFHRVRIIHDTINQNAEVHRVVLRGLQREIRL